MSITDPRDRFDDLHVVRNERTVDAATLAELGEYEAFRSGWVATAITLDERDRILLAYDGDDEQWVVPGGTIQSGESLREGVVREVREETGVTVTPERPRAVCDVVRTDADDSRSFRVVAFSATATDAEVGTDLGVDDENIERAAWFDELPEKTFDREFADAVLNQIREPRNPAKL
ncbi:NUDIX hydrolase [Haloprofundus salinisoli]|uniref:NUDIX hydrolase n=1 Tax=Haloprofundus salinisoli TaxID=2876193 RepID=UPI001CCA56B1|nr:NUDIX hydrolase [Haloprofundus salinisoli]